MVYSIWYIISGNMVYGIWCMIYKDPTKLESWYPLARALEAACEILTFFAGNWVPSTYGSPEYAALAVLTPREGSVLGGGSDANSKIRYAYVCNL